MRADPHIVITGSAGGIGRALAQYFIDMDWLVSGIDRAEPRIVHPRYAHHMADITDELAVNRVFDAASRRGEIAVVVANAAVTDRAHDAIREMEFSTWQTIQRVNVDGTFLTLRAAARRMREGNVVIVTSSLAFLDQAMAHDAPYCASKAALEMLMRVAALELRERGINVNSVYPSVKVDTGFFDDLDREERDVLARPEILNVCTYFLATRRPGALTGISLDQQRWDTDAAYRRSLGAET
jgi:3-oxoacyl-[acyl-carrier protein] reductase